MDLKSNLSNENVVKVITDTKITDNNLKRILHPPW